MSVLFLKTVRRHRLGRRTRVERSPIMDRAIYNPHQIQPPMDTEGRAGVQPSSVAAPPSLHEQLARTGRLFGGVVQDIARRLPWYADDFKQGAHPKVLASVLFLFFACLANAIAFGGLTSIVTHGEIGTLEMIVATAAGGIVFALSSGQPLTILGGTGPIVIFTGLLYQSCHGLGLPFLPVYAWVGLWSGIFLLILAATDASALMKYFTRFTDEIFAALIAVIFIVEAVRAVIVPVFDHDAPKDQAFLSLVLALGTFFLARTMKGFSKTPLLRRRLRQFISDFGPALAIAAMTGLALVEPEVRLGVAKIPEQLTTTTGRPWLVELWSLPTWAIFAAMGPALMASILLFLDQNITVRLVNTPAHKLKKGAGFHLDLGVVGAITAACSLFGLPWIVAATVHSLNHVRSLADVRTVEAGGAKEERIESVRENRVSALGIHVLIACSILILPLIKLIPMAVLFGLFLFMGVATLAGNQFSHRFTLWVTDPKLYPANHYVSRVRRNKMHLFTLIQVLCLVALWVLKASSLGILFPVLIALLVPLRLLMKRYFTGEELEALDAEDESEEAAQEPVMADVHA